MTSIFLETGKTTTQEYVFVRTLLSRMGAPKAAYRIECVGGKDNLPSVAVKMQGNAIEGIKNVVVFDADGPENGGGFSVRKQEILNILDQSNMKADLFLFPNNHDDGDVETLLEQIARRDLHQQFFDCFRDYETCLGNNYNTPDRKGKLFTYMSAQKSLSKTQRDRLGQGEWQFADARYWNLDHEAVKPLKDFLTTALL